ncbi:DivIVA domain-containing protein [Corallococcus sp. CA053C]|uniref:DivIVA domain-containing protein n=1 Tax=Corallococcus sp. CA053C TaxID=2316732 RepID=UPI000EA290C5|nr:DivIVA domain-containing protein [Corallococcus sp. CA053C]RKH11858.1 DivIVA domain-containing protein [Corallococcus sp. CA053C]
MKITPLDIRQKRFETAMRGYARPEVSAYLELIAGEFEEVVKENIALKEELKRTQHKLEQHQERERTLQETMVTAQRISEDLKDAAKKEAEIIIADAEHQAEKIVHGAHQRLVQVVEDINELKRQRTQFESQVRSVVEAHRKLLETFAAPSFADRDYARVEDNVAFLTQKKANSND